MHGGLGAVTPSSEGRMVFTFDKLALLRGQVLRVYIYEACIYFIAAP